MNRHCIHCQHCVWPQIATGDLGMIEATAACEHPNNRCRESPVIGIAEFRLCVDARSDQANCGPDGAWFEPLKGEPGA